MKEAATEVFEEDPTQQAHTQEDQQHIMYKLFYIAQRNTGFFKFPKSLVQNALHHGLYLIFANTHFPALYGASLSMGGVPLICGFPNLGIVSSFKSPPS